MQHLNAHYNPNGLAYYKGTALPNVPTEDLDFQTQSNDMIALGLQRGVSLKQQGIHYKNQLDLMQSTLCRYACGLQIKPWVFEKVCEHFKMEEQELIRVWYLNVIALDNLNIIKSDDDIINGIIYMDD